MMSRSQCSEQQRFILYSFHLPILRWLGPHFHGPHSGITADAVATMWNGDGSSGRKMENVTSYGLAHRVKVTWVTFTHFSWAPKTQRGLERVRKCNSTTFQKGENENMGVRLSDHHNTFNLFFYIEFTENL